MTTHKAIQKGKRALVYGLSIFMAVAFVFPQITQTQAATLEDQIDQKDSESEELESRIAELEGEIKEKQDEAASLRNQVGIFEDSIKKKELEIDKKEAEIDKTNLEIKQTKASISDAEKRIKHEKEVLAELIRTLNYTDDTSPVELILSNFSFSDILDNIQYIETLQGDAQSTLDGIKELKSQLEAKRQELESKKAAIEKQQTELEFKVSELEGAQEEKQRLLNATESEEEKYQDLLGQAKSDYDKKQSEIQQLEKELREKAIQYGDPQPYASGFVWPLPAGSGIITCPFHCSGYFPGLVHTGVDIAAPVGTPIYSATTGVVVHAGWSASGGGYGQYVVVSSGNLLIIYGHMSSVAVSVGQEVSAGTGIGGVGSTGFSTGPHLHFEIRQNGAPINPLQFY